MTLPTGHTTTDGGRPNSYAAYKILFLEKKQARIKSVFDNIDCSELTREDKEEFKQILKEYVERL